MSVLSCSGSLERDFVGVYRVPAPGREISLLFIVFPLPRERLCRYLSCSRSPERDFVDIYRISVHFDDIRLRLRSRLFKESLASTYILPGDTCDSAVANRC